MLLTLVIAGRVVISGLAARHKGNRAGRLVMSGKGRHGEALDCLELWCLVNLLAEELVLLSRR